MPELEGVGAGGPLNPQYLADQSTLLQPKRADYPHLLLQASPNFFTFRHHCLGFCMIYAWGYYLIIPVLLWSEKKDRFAFVGFTGDFWHKIENFMKTKIKNSKEKNICFFYIDLTTWPNLTKFCSLTLAGASPRTPWWTLGCLKPQT